VFLRRLNGRCLNQKLACILGGFLIWASQCFSLSIHVYEAVREGDGMKTGRVLASSKFDTGYRMAIEEIKAPIPLLPIGINTPICKFFVSNMLTDSRPERV
jgi:hypothetical protein